MLTLPSPLGEGLGMGQKESRSENRTALDYLPFKKYYQIADKSYFKLN